jgi:hypothetical protein
MWYLVGAVSGGAAVGALSGAGGALAFGGLTTGWVAGIATALAVRAAAIDGFGVRVPSPERQVNESWLTRYRPWVYGLGFGFQLGTGVMTFIKTAAVYLLWLLAALTADPVTGAAVGAWFGLVRGGALLTVASIQDPDTLRSYFRRLTGLAPIGRWAPVAAALAAAAIAPLAVLR